MECVSIYVGSEVFDFVTKHYGTYIWSAINKEHKLEDRIVGTVETDKRTNMHTLYAWGNLKCDELEVSNRKKSCDKCKIVYNVVKCAWKRYKKTPAHSPIRLYTLGKVCCLLWGLLA